MVGDLLRAVVGHVSNRDAGHCRGRPIDLVHADAVAQNSDAAAKRPDRGTIKRPDAGYDDDIRVADLLARGHGPRREHQFDAPRREDAGLDVV